MFFDAFFELTRIIDNIQKMSANIIWCSMSGHTDEIYMDQYLHQFQKFEDFVPVK